MALITVKPTRIDIAIANEIADHTNPELEQIAEALTWGADEHVLLALAAAGWLYARLRLLEERRAANHILAVSLATAVLPHILKTACDQVRPDRLTVRGHRRGIPFSGRPRDAFPSGHAVHMGALASAASFLPPTRRRFVRSIAVGLSLTRVIDADDFKRIGWRTAAASDDTQERVLAYWQHQPFCEARPRSTAKRQTQVMNDGVQPRRASRRRSQYPLGETLSEDLASAQDSAAAEAAGDHQELYHPPGP